MKIFLSQALISTCLILTIASAQATPKSLDKIIAVVNESVILQSELDTRISQVSKNAQNQNMALPDAAILQEQVVNHLVSEQLQLGMAKRVGFSVNDAQVNTALNQIRTSREMSMADFAQFVQATEGISLDALREKIRREMTIQQIQQGMVQQRIYISPLELDSFLQSADAQFWMSPEYHLGHILISLPQSATADQLETARQKALKLVAKINNGTSFGEVAIAESDGPSALKGGDIGWRKTSALPSLFAEIVPKLETGQVSEPFRSPAGFHILKLYDKKGEKQQLQAQTKARHILLKPSAILTDEDAEAKLKKIRKEILGGADFSELAKEHSEDIGSMLSGGSLGWSRPGMFVPEFEKAINAHKIGEISQPFKSQFGWHILQVEERRKEDITEEVRRSKAANILTSRRFEDELQIWLRELRDEAYVIIKI